MEPRRRAGPSAMVWSWRAVALVVLTAAAPASAFAFQADTTGTGRGREIEAVDFDGAVSLDRVLLIDAIASKPSRCRTTLAFLFCLVGDFDFAEIKQFLQDTAQVTADAERLETLYEIWGYPDARAEGAIVDQSDGDVVIRFTVDEGAPIVVRSLDLRGLDAVFPAIQPPQPMPLRTGEPYALPRLEALIRLLQERAAERGHPYAEVEVSGDVDEAARAADLALVLEPGPAAVFGAARIEAEPPMSEDAVLARLAYRPGDRYASDLLRTTVRRMYDLPVVERAVVQPIAPLERDTAVGTRVFVETRRVHGFDGEGTVSSSDCLGAAGFWRHRYFLGGPRVLALGASVSNLFAAQADGGFPCSSTGEGEFGELNYSVQGEVWQPSLFGDARYTWRAGAFARRQSSPNAWIERGWGGRLGLSRQMGRGLTALLDYTFERNELEASGIYFCGNYGVCSDDGIASLSASTRLAPLEGVLLWESSPLPVELRPADLGPGTAWPSTHFSDWRWTARLAVEAAGTATASEYGFTRAIFEGSGTRLLGRAGALAARIRAGFLGGDDVLPPQVRLYSGGANTVRGAEQNLLGPKVLLAHGGVPDVLCEDPIACDEPPVDPRAVSVRSTGGDRLVEANVEARFWAGSMLQLAAFLDFGRLTQDGNDTAVPGARGALRQTILTPGVGFRLITDIGPIRVDLGYDPSGARVYPLFAATDGGGILQTGFVRFDPFAWDDPGFFRETMRRLQFHFAIGQAF